MGPQVSAFKFFLAINTQKINFDWANPMFITFIQLHFFWPFQRMATLEFAFMLVINIFNVLLHYLVVEGVMAEKWLRNSFALIEI